MSKNKVTTKTLMYLTINHALTATIVFKISEAKNTKNAVVSENISTSVSKLIMLQSFQCREKIISSKLVELSVHLFKQPNQSDLCNIVKVFNQTVRSIISQF
jgi:hypothetical protein